MELKKQSLKKFNTFKIETTAKKIIIANSIYDILLAWQFSKKKNIPFLILGQGSNVLFVNNYPGIVVINKIKGIMITEDKNFWYLHVNSGEKWNCLVNFSLKNGFFGIENLALIPGTVGAAPIQNIGAYGIEFKQICQYVDLLNCYNKKIIRINAKKCEFTYRNSIFKNCYSKGLVIIAVGIFLKKKWTPNISYFNNKNINNKPLAIFQHICKIRKKKLPNPDLIGNAGSFFKNPILDINQANFIYNKFPDAILYKISSNTFKISAGWMIEKCNLKGYSIGNAAVYHKHALILINKNNNAKWQEIMLLSQYIRNIVNMKFNLSLELEINII